MFAFSADNFTGNFANKSIHNFYAAPLEFIAFFGRFAFFSRTQKAVTGEQFVRCGEGVDNRLTFNVLFFNPFAAVMPRKNPH